MRFYLMLNLAKRSEMFEEGRRLQAWQFIPTFDRRENIDDRPSSDLLLFHPYFTLNNKCAQNRLIQYWKENTENLRRHFQVDEFNRWCSLSEHVKLIVTDEEQSLWTWNQVKQMFEISIICNYFRNDEGCKRNAPKYSPDFYKLYVAHSENNQ
jgi:hypothetical protein